MTLKIEEKKAILFSLLIVLAFIIIRFFSNPIHTYYDEANYLLIHTLLELFSVFISYSIFFYGWLTFPHTKSYRLLILSMIFFAVGTFDLFHTLLFNGTIFFADIDRAIASSWLWMAARFTAAVGIIAVFLIPYRVCADKKRKNVAQIITLLYTFVITFFIFQNTEHLPPLIIKDLELTALKIFMEICLILFHLIALFFILKTYMKSEREQLDLLTIAIGIIFLVVGETIFTLFHHVYNIDNLLAHLYKTLGYFCLLKGIYIPKFEEIFKEKEKAEFKWHKAEEKLRAQEKKMTSLIIKAQEDERKRVSQDLHDGIGQMLYSILISLRNVKRLIKDEKIVNHIKEIETLTRNTMDEVRNIAHMLRPCALDDLGFIPAIRSHIEQFSKTFQIEVDLHIDGSQRRVAPEIETALFRICQEALNNAAKYSKATSIDVIILIIDDHIELSVVDNGEGFDMDEINANEHQGLGLFGMYERAKLVNGKTTIVSNKGLGTQIHVAIPI